MNVQEIDRLISRYGAAAVIEAVSPLLENSRIERLESGLDSKLESLTVVMENLYDPHNGAAAMRSSEAFGLADMHIVDGETGAFEVAPDVCVGTQKWIDLHRHENITHCAKALKEKGFVLCATVPGAEMKLEDIPTDTPIALLFGNERDGLSEKARSLSEHQVSIPMQGFCQSFNLSVSVAMFVHRLAAKRRTVLGKDGDLSSERKEFLRARWRAMGIRGLSLILERYVSTKTH